VVSQFAADRRSGILGGVEQIEVLCQLLPPPPANPVILDLGCGDGVLTEAVRRVWPGAHSVAVDGSSPMLEKAAQRFEGDERVKLIHADFNDPAWRDRLSVSRFDAVVSGFAIHHSEDDRKRALYAEIFDLLGPGAPFVNVEHVASATPHGERLFERAFALQLTRSRGASNPDVKFEDVLRETETRLDKAANRLAPVETQLEWLREIGFEHVDCYWKHYELAVLAGYKPAA
jgi:SAM-dependent methyltransferase